MMHLREAIGQVFGATAAHFAIFEVAERNMATSVVELKCAERTPLTRIAPRLYLFDKRTRREEPQAVASLRGGQTSPTWTLAGTVHRWLHAD